MDPTRDNWKKVEKNLNSFFGTVSERYQSIRSLSYNYLPQYLKACFLYVGGFPEDTEINVSQLIKLWIAEQFVKARKDKRLEVVAEECLQELIDRSLILAGKQRANGRMRSCKIHDLLHQLCLSEAHTENVMDGNVLEAIDDQRRMILLSEFKLLKVLDVLSIDYDFSSVIPELVQLRYAAARIKEAVSLAKLINLQTIILKGLEWKEREQQVDIWGMSELTHLDIRSPLYISNPVEAENDNIGEQPLFLNNLQTLYLRNSRFVVEILRRTPNLKNLELLSYFALPDWPAILDFLSLVQDLETLHIQNMKCMIFYGDNFPPNLKQLK
uniref:Disease resistance protein n=1 Tax=Solanum tuberosum TaxID=4113 RepID=M1BJ61_SOLTU